MRNGGAPSPDDEATSSDDEECWISWVNAWEPPTSSRRRVPDSPTTNVNEAPDVLSAGVFVTRPRGGHGETEVLIMQRGRWKGWQFAKGRLKGKDQGDLVECAVRELAEETGVRLRLLPRDLFSKVGRSKYEYSSGMRKEVQWFRIHADRWRDFPCMGRARERATRRVHWVTLGELRRLNVKGDQAEMATEAIRQADCARENQARQSAEVHGRRAPVTPTRGQEHNVLHRQRPAAGVAVQPEPCMGSPPSRWRKQEQGLEIVISSDSEREPERQRWPKAPVAQSGITKKTPMEHSQQGSRSSDWPRHSRRQQMQAGSSSSCSSGHRQAVADVEDKVSERDEGKPADEQRAACHARWEWDASSGAKQRRRKWRGYEKKVSEQMEEARARGGATLAVKIDGCNYTINFETMEQVRVSTKFSRKIRCCARDPLEKCAPPPVLRPHAHGLPDSRHQPVPRAEGAAII